MNKRILNKQNGRKPRPNVYLTPGNLARLQAVGVALECDPTCLLNNFLCEELVTPSGMAEGCMDFTEGGKLTEKEAAEAERRVIAAAELLDNDGWGREFFYPEAEKC